MKMWKNMIWKIGKKWKELWNLIHIFPSFYFFHSFVFYMKLLFTLIYFDFEPLQIRCLLSGVLVIVGLGPNNDVSIPLISLATSEIDIRGIFRYANCYPTALDLVASGKVDLKKLITHRYQLKDTVKAFEAALNREGVKIVINCE